MAKVRIKASRVQFKNFATIMKSDGVAELLEDLAEPVLTAAKQDPNEFYVSTLSMHRFYTDGRSGRVSVQVGAAPEIGGLVEAKRGTLARAMGLAGL